MRHAGVSAVLAVLLLVISSAAVFGQAPAPRQQPRGIMERMKQELGLSDDQAAKVQAAMAAYRQRTGRVTADMRTARGDLDAQMRLRAPDRARVDSVITRIAGLQAEMLRAQVEMQIALKQILTPEQEERYRTLMRDRFNRGPRNRPQQPRPQG